ncbi:hypothetical protein BpHYR1_046893 [Brachionus plicatilis]|uniref:Uncharacterized protein n=1 Tax=Brachionus plicatilis TaxID=10195 RepID=A0A3M7PVV9_BRAPC|nr:hypothetical protein BpHYR1_046893 [Brachionus plicatilis]
MSLNLLVTCHIYRTFTITSKSSNDLNKSYKKTYRCDLIKLVEKNFHFQFLSVYEIRNKNIDTTNDSHLLKYDSLVQKQSKASPNFTKLKKKVALK